MILTGGDGKKYFIGKFSGQVFDHKDPKKLGRIRAYVPDVGFVDKPTDWAFPNFSFGAGKEIGNINVSDIFDNEEKRLNVWMEFEGGDPNKPIWSGCYYSEPDGKSEVPKLARGEEDESVQPVEHARGTAEDTYAAEYPYNRVLKTKSGIIFEWDDTEGAIRIKVWHPTGTFFDIDNDGNMRQEIVGDFYRHIAGNFLEKIDGDKAQVIGKNNTKLISGEAKYQSGGNYQVESGKKVYTKAAVDIEDNAPFVYHNTNGQPSPPSPMP